VDAALLALRKAGSVHYVKPGTPESSLRWDGILHDRRFVDGEFPHQSDCSSFATWCLWNGLFLKYDRGDIVNGQHWDAGYTGTMRDHGMRVGNIPHDILRGDCVFYQGHVTIVVGRKNGVPMVVSHGSEGGPYHVKWNYRTVLEVRRYI
jgi:cell wall-associated NlpC family hydrolase